MPDKDRNRASPDALLREWTELVDGCHAGYEWNVYQYHSDLAVRDRLDEVLREGCCDAAFGVEVERVDERFRALLQPGVQVGPDTDPWWHRGVPRYAGPDFVDGMRDWFETDVEVREPA